MEEFIQQMNAIFRRFGNLIDAVMLVDGKKGSVQLSYPEGDKSLHFMGNAAAVNMAQFDTLIKGSKLEFPVQEMELLSQDKIVWAVKISDDVNYLLCIVSPNPNVNLGLIKNMFEQTVREEIITAMQTSGLIKKA